MLDATRTIVAKTSYDKLTFAAVARQAGLYTKYISRNWSSKAELIRDALLQGVDSFETHNTGSLEGDLRALVQQQVDLICRPEYLNGLNAVEAAHLTGRELLGDTLDRFVGPLVAVMAEIFDRAVRRGELQSAPDPLVTVTAVSGAIKQVYSIRLLPHDEIVELGIAMVLGGTTGTTSSLR